MRAVTENIDCIWVTPRTKIKMIRNITHAGIVSACLAFGVWLVQEKHKVEFRFYFELRTCIFYIEISCDWKQYRL